MNKTELLDKLSQPEGLEVSVIPLRDVVVYPSMVLPLFVGREKSIKALDSAIANGHKYVFLATQRESENNDPGFLEISTVGVVASILQLLKLPNGTVKVLVEGVVRARIDDFQQEEPYLSAMARDFRTIQVAEEEEEALTRALFLQFEKYVKLNKKVPQEILATLNGMQELERVVDTIIAQMPLRMSEKQKLLETAQVTDRIELLIMYIEAELDLLEIGQKIRTNVKQQIEKNQREHFLHEQMKAIQDELGHGASDSENIRKRIEESGMSVEAKEKAFIELKKLQMMPPMSAEATVCRNYLDVMLDVPWVKRSKVKFALDKAKEVLDGDHFGLEKVKERILEYLAVQKRVKKLKGPILCLVGPPGVGKTSLGQSIAKATGRKFVRFALGGIRDEAEIRGHRRTYIGAMPGKIIQRISKSQVRNPLFLLDEIDKMAMDFRGDPASALLEVLDPEQNNTFSDNYLEVDYDLSEVMFIATANSYNIPPALLDRMEVINLSGYIEDEKMNIAKNYLITKQKKAHGLRDEELTLEDNAILNIIRYYTKEAGVRGLEREISKLCRKVVKALTEGSLNTRAVINKDNLEEFLGVARYRFGVAEDNNRVGQVTGLAWTEVGGDILTIESVVVPGKGKTIRTGKLGEVMLESIQAAMTVVRSRTKVFGLDEDFYAKQDFHIHVPEGATPKDGPSAGIAMCTALVSSLTEIPVRADVAMTGEITLRGEVLPIGGLKEKLLAARRAGIKQVIIPAENERDLKEIPSNITDDLTINLVKWIDEVFDIALAVKVEDYRLSRGLTENDAIAAKLGTLVENETDRLA